MVEEHTRLPRIRTETLCTGDIVRLTGPDKEILPGHKFKSEGEVKILTPGRLKVTALPFTHPTIAEVVSGDFFGVDQGSIVNITGSSPGGASLEVGSLTAGYRIEFHSTDRQQQVQSEPITSAAVQRGGKYLSANELSELPPGKDPERFEALERMFEATTTHFRNAVQAKSIYESIADSEGNVIIAPASNNETSARLYIYNAQSRSVQIVRSYLLPSGEKAFTIETFTDVNRDDYLTRKIGISIPFELCDIRYTHIVSNGPNDGRACIDIDEHQVPDVEFGDPSDSNYAEFEENGEARIYGSPEVIEGVRSYATDTEFVAESEAGSIRIPRKPAVDSLVALAQRATLNYSAQPKPF